MASTIYDITPYLNAVLTMMCERHPTHAFTIVGSCARPGIDGAEPTDMTVSIASNEPSLESFAELVNRLVDRQHPDSGTTSLGGSTPG